MDTKTKRAAALGYGLAFLAILPVADGTIGIEDAGHALAAYSWDMPALINPHRILWTAEALTSPALTGEALTSPALTGETLTSPALTGETLEI